MAVVSGIVVLASFADFNAAPKLLMIRRETAFSISTLHSRPDLLVLLELLSCVVDYKLVVFQKKAPLGGAADLFVDWMRKWSEKLALIMPLGYIVVGKAARVQCVTCLINSARIFLDVLKVFVVAKF